MDDLGANSVSDIADKKIPVIDMDQHHDAYKMIKSYIEQGLLPRSGNTIVHLDAHLDHLVPSDLQIRSRIEPQIPGKRGMFHDFGVEDWLKIAVGDNCLRHVIWVKPPWAIQVEDGHLDLDNDVTLDIKTLGRSIFEDHPEDYKGFQSLFSSYLSPGEPWILDIDYNFLSSDSPFAADKYTEWENYYPMLQTMFELKVPESRTEANLQQAKEERTKQLTQLYDIFHYLQEHRALPPGDEYSNDLYEKVVKFREELLKHYEEKDVEWKIVYDYGIMANDYIIPVHRTDPKDIERMVEECLGNMLKTAPSPPSLITIAVMYDYDRYTPKKHRKIIAKALKNLFIKRYNIEYIYLDY